MQSYHITFADIFSNIKRETYVPHALNIIQWNFFPTTFDSISKTSFYYKHVFTLIRFHVMEKRSYASLMNFFFVQSFVDGNVLKYLIQQIGIICFVNTLICRDNVKVMQQKALH